MLTPMRQSAIVSFPIIFYKLTLPPAKPIGVRLPITHHDGSRGKAFSLISLISSPLSVTATIRAFLWSIHNPTFVLINFSFVHSL